MHEEENTLVLLLILLRIINIAQIFVKVAQMVSSSFTWALFCHTIVKYMRPNNGRMKIEIIRSKKRKKTMSARVVNGAIVVRVPANLTSVQEQDAVAKLVRKIEKSRVRTKLNSDSELKKRAKFLTRRYIGDNLNLKSIKYVTNQNTRHGSCTTSRGSIRISHNISKMPSWVRDYVIIHELAHLVHPDHSEAFWNLVYQYEYAERARGYLLGFEAGKDSA